MLVIQAETRDAVVLRNVCKVRYEDSMLAKESPRRLHQSQDTDIILPGNCGRSESFVYRKSHLSPGLHSQHDGQGECIKGVTEFLPFLCG